MSLHRDARGLMTGTVMVALCLISWSAWPHGFAGKRFFPSTLATDDPFVSDEFSLMVNHIKESATLSTEFSADYTKRITPYFGLSFGGAFRHLDPKGADTINGFSNLDLGAKYQFFTSEAHETLLSVGLGAEVGGTGDENVGADRFSTISPTIFFGKGMGDLPDPVKYLRPFAITGIFGANFPTESHTVTVHLTEDGELEREVERHPTTLSWGFSLQYNLQYLQSFVHDVGLPAPFNRMIPVVEFALQTCLNRGCDGRTTGTVNPGIVWFGKYVQLGIEAQIPINGRTGDNVGFLAQLHLFIDDLFPGSLGRPLIGEGRARPAWWQPAQ